MAAKRFVLAALLTILVQTRVASGASWWTSRAPARFDVDIWGGGGYLPFEDSWTTTSPFKDEESDGIMALGFRGGGGWTHPSGNWGVDAQLGRGTRLSLFESDTTTGSFTSADIFLRWDPFCTYQVAPVFGAGLSAWKARQHLWVGTGAMLFSDDETWGYIDQERSALALGLRSGFRIGWFEMRSEITFPVASQGSKSVTVVDTGWDGHFSRTESDQKIMMGYSLRIPIHALDGGVWESRRKEYGRIRDSARLSHAWSVGYEITSIPPAWIWNSALDEAAVGPRAGLGIRWDIASPSHSDRGLVLDLYQGMQTGESDGEIDSHGSLSYGGDAGVWWMPVVGDFFSLRWSGTLGLWNAVATANVGSSDSDRIIFDWWGARARVGARAETRLFYVGGKLDLDFVFPGDLDLPQGIDRPARADLVAMGGGVELGLRYLF